MNKLKTICIVMLCMMLVCGCAQGHREYPAAEKFDEFQSWLAEEKEEYVGEAFLGIMVPYSSEIYYLSFAGDSSRDVALETMMGREMTVAGRKDNAREYFEGSVEWSGTGLCVVDFTTMEYVMLEENVKSFTIGDYYVSCDFYEEEEKLDLLVFYCPV